MNFGKKLSIGTLMEEIQPVVFRKDVFKNRNESDEDTVLDKLANRYFAARNEGQFPV